MRFVLFFRGTPYEFSTGKKRRIVSKTVQHWLPDVIYREYNSDPQKMDKNFDFVVWDETLLKLSRKLEVVFALNSTAKFASTQYQVTNYGLGGKIHLITLIKYFLVSFLYTLG